MTERGYKALRASGIIAMPSVTTMRAYQNYGAVGSGCHLSNFERAMVAFQHRHGDKPGGLYMNMAFDEMKIKESMVYELSTGKILGITDSDMAGTQSHL